MDIINYALSKKKVTMPVDAGGTAQNGISGQILQSNGDGTTQWVSAFPFEVEILETICENVELTPDNNTYTLPSKITLNYLDLYYIDYKTFRNGVIEDTVSGVYFSRVIEKDGENYIGWFSDRITLKSTQITDNWMHDSSILSIYKVSLNVSDSVLDEARKLEGYGTIASGFSSHAEGYGSTASGGYSHAEGIGSTASGNASHAEGYGTIASGFSSHAEGYGSTASGDASHAEGYGSTASGFSSHAEGYGSTASGDASHAEGIGSTASGNASHAEGRYNIEDTDEKYAHIVGNGNPSARSNAHTLDWDGNAWFAGDVFVGGSSHGDGAKLLKTGEAIPIPKTASVGQVLVINSVDENGKPTEWEAVDTMVVSSSTPGSTKKFKITVDDNGTISTTEVI